MSAPDTQPGPTWRSWFACPACRHSVLWLWLGTTATSWLAATPFALQVRGALSGLPQGDAALFEPGGVLLLELTSLHSAGLASAVAAGLVLLVAFLPVSLFLHATLFQALTRRGRIDTSLALAARAGLPDVPRFFALWLMTRTVQAALLLVLALLSGTLAKTLEFSVNERTRDMVQLLGVLFGASLCIPVQLLAELTRAELAAQASLRAALLGLQRHVRRELLGLLGSWLGCQLVGLTLLIAAGPLVGLLPLEVSGSLPALLAAVIHQLAILGSYVAYACAAALTVEWVRSNGVSLPKS